MIGVILGPHLIHIKPLPSLPTPMIGMHPHGSHKECERPIINPWVGIGKKVNMVDVMCYKSGPKFNSI